MSSKGEPLLSDLLERLRTNFAADQKAQSYLNSNGIGDERVWSEFRIGSGNPSIQEAYDAEQQHVLTQKGLIARMGCNEVDGGILLPTFDPNDFSTPVGFVKLAFAQNKHHFASTPKGIACSATINEHQRIILTDTPLLGLRLAQAGAGNVVIAEDPASSLPQLRDWLGQREIVLASYRNDSFPRLAAGLGEELAKRAPTARAHTELPYTNAETLGILGIGFESGTITPQLIAKIVTYSQSRLADGQGLKLLRQLGADDAEFIQTYRIGYLPDDFIRSLDTTTKRTLNGRIFGDCLIAPTYDESDGVLDLLSIRRKSSKAIQQNLLPAAQGMLAPKIATSNHTIQVTNVFAVAMNLWRAGERNCVVLRDAADAKNNAVRLLDAGVRKAKFIQWDGDDLHAAVQALRSAQISVETPSNETHESDMAPMAGVSLYKEGAPAAPSSGEVTQSTIAEPKSEPVAQPEGAVQPDTSTFDSLEYPDKPVLLTHDPRMLRARFQSGDVTYEVDTALDCGSKLEVTVERAGERHRDRFDLSKAAQRKRFSESAAIRTKTPFEVIERHLIHLLDGVRAIQEEILSPIAKKASPGTLLSDVDKAEALELLRKPHLLDVVAEDMEALGWAGEPLNKRLLYLCSVSRLLPLPVSAAVRSPASSGKSHALEMIAMLTPSEDIVQISRASAAAFHLHPDLRHKIVLIDEADALTQEVIVSLRVLQSRGALSQSVVERDSLTGRAVTRVGETKGPVSVLTSTTGELDGEFIARCYDLTVDTSDEQTKRILEMQRRLRADPDLHGTEGRHARIVKRHHALQRMLAIERKPVIIPYADRIEFPSNSVQFRREQQKLLSLIEASALLHSFSRLRQKNSSGEEVIVADQRDFEIAVGLVSFLIHRAGDELSANGRDVLTVVRSARLQAFTLADIKAIRPDWTRHKIYNGLEDLARIEIVTCSRGRGKARCYSLQEAGNGYDVPAVRLKSGGKLSDSTTGDNNFIPVRAIG